MNYRVRFHLGRGQNHKKFQVRHPDGRVTYHDPSRVQILMVGCRLHNQNRIAEAICAGRNKTVCAWVDADSVWFEYPSTITIDSSKAISFNPKKVPYWTDGISNLDGKTYPEIITSGSNLYLK